MLLSSAFGTLFVGNFELSQPFNVFDQPLLHFIINKFAVVDFFAFILVHFLLIDLLLKFLLLCLNAVKFLLVTSLVVLQASIFLFDLINLRLDTFDHLHDLR